MGHARNRVVCAFVAAVVCVTNFAACQTAARASATAAASSTTPSRITSPPDDTRLVRLPGNTYPSVRPDFDKGPVEPGKVLERIVLVLKRSPEQEAALAAFNERQYDPKSPDFHRWLHADEFGKLYGPSDDDIASVTSWLQNHGFQIVAVGNGRVWIQFTGTVRQVEETFHVQMRNYLVNGKMHISNDKDPEIPEALAPVVTGIASLNDFRPRHYSHPGNYVKRDLQSGKISLWARNPKAVEPELVSDGMATQGWQLDTTKAKGVIPEFGYVNPSTDYQHEDLTPYDVATIYNILPLWNASTPINGKGVKVAIVALSDVVTSDFNTYRSSFGLPAGTLTTLHSGTDPGVTDSQSENTEDVEMVSATAPGAQVVLVADVDNATTNGLVTAITYIVDNEVAPILTMSYGACELEVGTAGNSLWNQTFQQATTAGISSFVAAGDSGSATCTSQDGTPPYADQYGLAVSGMASTPYATAVGGTDLQWPFVEATTPSSTYWNATNASNGSSAKGYMPELSWNVTCTNPLLLNVFTSESSVEQLCNDAINGDPGLVEMGSGGGGVSACTTSGTSGEPSTCSGGYAKPSWQAGVTGIPADGKRDLPDVAMFASYGFQWSTGIPGSALLICMASNSPERSCDYTNPNYIIYQENGGTSAASPMTAGIMALIVQKTGSAQGLANPVFYSLAAKENYSKCNSNTVQPGNSCIFYDTTTGSNAMNCYTGSDADCITATAGDQAGILKGYSATAGYDLTTGLGSFNVTNLVNAWPGASAAATTTTFTVAPGDTFGVGTVATLTATVLSGSKKPTAGSVTFSVEGVTLGSATVNGSGVATLTASSNGLAPGHYPVIATYGGTTGYGSSVSPTVTVDLTKAATATVMTASPTSVTRPAKVTLTATVKRSTSGAKGTPTGSVTFTTGSTTLATVKLNGSGVASLTASTSGYPAGTYSVVAKYAGDSSDVTSTASAVKVTLK